MEHAPRGNQLRLTGSACINKVILLLLREYMPFIYEELLFENVVAAYHKHFKKRIESDMVCNILAGERGPSCSKMSQIPDQKVFYVRFIKSDVTTVEDDEDVEDTDIVVGVLYMKRFKDNIC